MARAHRKDRGLYVRTLKDGSTVWGVRLAVQGRMLRFSPFPTKTTAREFYEKAKTEQREGRFFPEKYQARGPSVQTFIDRYMLTITHKKTASEERNFASWWGQWYKGRAIRAITAEDLEEARQALLEGYGGKKRQRTPARVNRYTQWLHQAFSHPVNRPHLPYGANAVDSIKKYPEARPARPVMNHKQEKLLLASLEQETPGSTAFVKLAVICGLRQAEEFARLKTEVDTQLWIITIPNAKHQNEPKVIRLPPAVRPYINKLLQSPGPWLIHNRENHSKPFPIKTWYKTVFRRAVKAAGLPDTFTWHSLRHTFASRMLMSGASTNTVRHAGGWSSVKMVDQVYGHLADQFVEDAMERAATTLEET